MREVFGAHLAQMLQIFMRVEGAEIELQHRQSNIGAVVADSLEVREQVVEHEPLRDGALAVLQPLHMVQLHLVAEIVDDVLQRLHLFGFGEIIIFKDVR